MKKRPFIIFDAGGVLVFPDFKLLSEYANQVGINTSPTEIAEQHAKLFRTFDEYVYQYHRFPKLQYFRDLFKQITNSTEKAQAAFELTIQTDKRKHIWATTQPWVEESLRNLKSKGYQMAVISNSDGRVNQILQELHLREYFDIVIDSFIVGVEKPDARIFEIALNSLDWDPGETFYVGDIYYIDIWGANQAGLGAVHVDKMGLYNDWEGIHISSIMELSGLLEKFDGNIEEWNIFPTQGFEIKF